MSGPFQPTPTHTTAPAHAAPPFRTRFAPAQKAGPMIMVVEDNEAVRDSLSMLLRTVGHEVLEAGHGAEALSLLETHRPGLIFCDVSMPVMNGLEFAQKLRDSGAGFPLVFVTAFCAMADSARSLAL